jgi:carnitine 3-dehydrogenase
MSIDPGAIRTIAVVGTGTIGASWATLFLAHGLDVIASDPAADAETRLRAFIAGHYAMRDPSPHRPRAS